MHIPKWLKLQRTSLFLFLAFAVILLIYALGFITDVYIFYAYGDKGLTDFYNEMQRVNADLLWKAVCSIILAVVLFALGLGRYPAGLFTLCVCVLAAALSLYFSLDSLAVLSSARQKYEALDFRSLNRYIERGTIKYSQSTLTYELGILGYGLFLISALFMFVVVLIQSIRRPVSSAKKELP